MPGWLRLILIVQFSALQPVETISCLVRNKLIA